MKTTVMQRVRVAAKAAVGVFSETSAREAYGMLAGIYPGSVGQPPERGARERVAAFADMPWLQAVGDKIAMAFASVDWSLSAGRPRGAARAVRYKAVQRAGPVERRRALRALRQAGELVPVETHPLLDLLDDGNGFMTGLGLRRLTSIYLDVEGEAFWLKERNGVGAPVGAWPLPPDWVRATPTPTSREFRVGFRGWNGPVPDTEILWFSRHNPSNPYGRGAGLGRALADELETDEYAARFVRQTFFNQNRPDFVVYPGADGETWGTADRDRLQEAWRGDHEGFWRAFRARFASRKLGIYEFKPTDFRHLQMIQLRQHERDTIVQVFGVPPELLGILENSNRATIEAADFLFARWVLVPRLEAFRAILQERLVPEYDDRLIIDYASPVGEDRALELQAATAAPWAPTVDEWRAMQGLPEKTDGAGKVHMIPFALTPTALDGSPSAPPPPPAGADFALMSTEDLLRLRGAVDGGEGPAERSLRTVEGLVRALLLRPDPPPPPPPPAPVVNVAPAPVTVNAPVSVAAPVVNVPAPVTVNNVSPPTPPMHRDYIRDEKGLIVAHDERPVVAPASPSG